jgi:hypothetical protein
MVECIGVRDKDRGRMSGVVVVEVGMVGRVGMEEVMVVEDVMDIVIGGFMSMTPRCGAMSICMGILILFGVIVLVVDVKFILGARCDGSFVFDIEYWV